MSKSLPQTKKLFTVTTAAKYLGISAITLRRWDAAGKLRSHRTLGGSRRYSKEELDSFKNSQIFENSIENKRELDISEAAKILGVTTKTLRNWEKAGKLTSVRDEHNYRVYEKKKILSLGSSRENFDHLFEPVKEEKTDLDKQKSINSYLGRLLRVKQIGKKHFKTAHFHVKKTHLHLGIRFQWYSRWHRFKYHPHIHWAALGSYVLGVFTGIFFVLSGGLGLPVFGAGELTDTWDFSVPGNYTLSDSNLIEISDNNARLKAQEYSSDGNTVLLMHLNENSGNPVDDSSSNNNDGTATAPSWVSGNMSNGLNLNGTTSKISIPDSASISLSQQNTLEGWFKLSSSISAGSHDQRQGIFDKGDYQLYIDNETGKITYEIANSSTPSWIQQAGNDVNGSWDLNGNPNIESSVGLGSNVYIGTGNAVGDAEVWRWNGTTWTQIGGDGLNGCWAANTYDQVLSLATDGTDIYAGLGLTAQEAEVWKFTVASGTWSKIGGDGVNSSWSAAGNFEGVYSLSFFDGDLYAGLGNSNGDAEVWRLTSGTWTQVAGLVGDWGTSVPNWVYSLVNDGTYLYAGLGSGTNEAEVWRCSDCDGTPSWTKVGGDGVNSSWADSTYETVYSMTIMGGNLYAGIGLGANESEVWRCSSCSSSPSWTLVADGGGSPFANNTDGVYSLANDGTYVYAGLGNAAGENDVWRCSSCGSSPSWTQIGGDGLNSGFTNTHTIVNTLLVHSGTLYAGLNSASGTLSGVVWGWNGSSWTILGGDYINFSWGFRGLRSVEVMNAHNGYLYAGTGVATAGNAMVWESDGSNWTLIGGQGVNSSWTYNTYDAVTSMISHRGKLYVGLGSTATEAELWRWDGVWTKVGGDGVGSPASWTTAGNYEEVTALASYGGYLYAGLGANGNDGEVWRLDDSGGTPSWTKVGGDSLNSGWTNYSERIGSLAIFNGKLFAGVSGTGAGDAELWECTGCEGGSPSWVKVGGDGVSISWADTTYEYVDSIIPYNGNLIVGLGIGVGDAAVWQYDGSAWTKIGGDDVNNSWTSGTYERVRTIVVYNGEVYAGLGNSTGEGEVWKFDGTNWSQIGGDSLNSGWTNVVEEVTSFSPYKGKLYAGLGNTANADASIWSWGNNGYLQSATSSFNTNWHHVAATYDGAIMKIFINGVENATTSISQSIPNSTRALMIGTTYAGREQGKPQGYFQGSLDELRISNIARSTFNSTPYSSSPQTVRPAAAVRTYGAAAWDNFVPTEIANGGTITYRLSSDGGASWRYYNSGWVTSNSISEANSASVIDTNIPTFPVTNGGLMWQAILDGDGTQQVTVDQVFIDATHDVTNPSANGSSIAMQKTNGGPTVTAGNWTNNPAPYFSWTAGSDAQSGLRGYCLYLGTNSSGDPATSSGLISTTSPVSTTGTTCQFIIGTNNIDFATTAYRGSPWLTSSSGTYYLNLKAVDIAGNVFPSSASFNFKYDDTAPSNPATVSPPGGFVATYDVTTTWPTAGGSAPADSHSGIAGLQYKISGTGKWYGDTHNGAEDATDLLANDGSYTTQTDPDHGGSLSTDDLVEGENNIYFRTWDVAGNVTSSFVQGIIKINTSAPSAPQSLIATPTTNTVNSFAFDWDPPVTFQGSAGNITYCYTVNTLPSVNTCSFTAGGVTQLSAGAYANQPGSNTMYVVARDEASNINYATYASVSFTANTGSPGVPLNPDIADISVKATSNWRLAITWEPPTVVGAGVASYKIERSTDNVSYAQVASTSGTSYVDTGLTQVRYYYKVKACDSANSCGVLTSQVNEIPTGKFTEPAALTAEPKVTAVGTKTVTINWVTDRASDSRIAFGTSSGNYFGAEVSNSNQVTDHTITINNLTAGTTYYYKAKWVDEDGNQGQSAEKTFTTLPPPTISEVEARNINLTQATIKFTVKDASKVNILFGKSTEFGGLKTVLTATAENTVTSELTGLDDGTKYFYKLNSFDTDDNEYAGTVFSFSTLPRPRISDLKFEGVAGEPTSTMKITWTTNVPTTSVVNYSPTGGVEVQSFSAELKTDHEVILRELADNTQYNMSASGRDQLGNLVVSDSNTFRTALDTRPPKISDLTIETSIQGSGRDSKGQLIISWKTDEPSSSQIEYGEGSGGSYSRKTVEDTSLVTDHIVIVSDLSPSKTFHLRAVSRDNARNEGRSEDNSAITGRAAENVLDIIINSLRRSLGFLGEAFGGF